ncbi:tyrosine-type recombinase/integrase [Dysgonomonas sp. Marseille-P4361]|uniref:tyrosine-type recombinase/integrase n=1 Tax=Dysgonomonas sp. Marseille-P4361 TaxID=2161820 RepID=UPI000D55E727|nr:tyrosine-type recombinase/integrase [Dysgonomonas sp. Marseille-P4361]
MATVNFLLRSTKKEASINVNILGSNWRVRLSTGVKIPTDIWNTKKGWFTSYYNKPQAETVRYDILKSQLEEIKNNIELHLAKYGKIEDEDVRIIISQAKTKKVSKANIPTRMHEYLPFLMEQMKTGIRKTDRGTNYSHGTLKNWKSFSGNWNEFQEEVYNRKLTFTEVDNDVYSRFVDYLTIEKNFTSETLKTRISTLKAFLNYACEDKVHDNRDFIKFSKNFPTAKGKRPYLDRQELDALYNLELSDDMLLKVRDIFLIGCYTAQRVSDYNRITKEDIVTLKNGKLALWIYQQKTKKEVEVPFIDGDKATAILERWNYDLPKLGSNSDVLINRHIKTICRMAGIVEPFTTETVRGGKIIKETTEKCNLITTHTARRSALTILYRTGKFTTSELMYYSGHTSEKTFRRYICLSDNEQAIMISEKL